MKRIKVGWTAVLRSLPQRRIVGCALLGAVAPGLVVLAAVFAPASQGVRIGLEDTLHETTLASPRAASAAASEAVRSLQVLQPLPTAGERRQVASLSLMDPLEATAERTVRADQGMNLWAYSTMTTLILARPYHLNTVDGSPGADGAPTRLGKLAANLAQEKFPRVPAADKASAKDWQKALDFVWTDPASADNLKEAKSDLKALGISYNTSGELGLARGRPQEGHERHGFPGNPQGNRLVGPACATTSIPALPDGLWGRLRLHAGWSDVPADDVLLQPL